MKQRLGSEAASSCQSQRKEEMERKASSPVPAGSSREQGGSRMPKHLILQRCQHRLDPGLDTPALLGARPRMLDDP